MNHSTFKKTNSELHIEDVFKLSGMPTYTFVQPVEYDRLIVSLRTPGRGLVVEGPSGIGKTTGVIRALEELGMSETATRLSARKKDDCAFIAELPKMKDIGVVIVDDFHHLEADTKKAVADFLKILADEETPNSKLVLIGINKAGDSLVKFAADLNNRIDTLRFEANPDERIEELISKGEAALQISINSKAKIVKEAHGSFHIAQLISFHTCLQAGIKKACSEMAEIQVSLEVVREEVLKELARVFFDKARLFATGPRLRREGRAPYLYMLNWLSNSEDWSLDLQQAIAQHPEQKASVGQVIDKGYLADFLRERSELQDVVHYDQTSQTLSIEDPKFLYFLKNLIWNKFAKQIGYVSTEFKGRYDFALSFAGSDRDIAEALFSELSDAEISTFYDHNEQHRILANNVEDYLAPIYRSEAEFVIALLGRDYPNRIWTKFESEHFKQRFGEGRVVPIWFADVPMGMFDLSRAVGGLSIDRSKDLKPQIEVIRDTLVRKLQEFRMELSAEEGE